MNNFFLKKRCEIKDFGLMYFIVVLILILYFFFRRRLFIVRNKRFVFWGSVVVIGGFLIFGVGDFCFWGWGIGFLLDFVILCGFFY